MPHTIEPNGSADEQARLEARALADPTRRAIYHAIAAADRPIGVADLAEVVHVHHTVVRRHLAQLRSVGLVIESTEPPGGRGRPRLQYRLQGTARAASPDGDAYRRLASMLAEVVRTGVSPRRIGRAMGERAAQRTAEAIDPVDALEREAALLGFQPRRRRTARGAELVLRHCPFAEVAAQDPQTICQIHLGLAEGVVEGHGGARVTDLVVRDPHRAGCRLEVEVDPPAAGAHDSVSR